MRHIPDFTVVSRDDLALVANQTLRSMYTLSPFVWRSGEGFEIMVRAVNRDRDPTKKVARIYHGRSEDGLTFVVDRHPDIAPGPGADDAHGCEDPSVARLDDRLYVYYTGWNQDRKVGKLLMACGPDACKLQKKGVALESSLRHANPKEATIAKRKDGTWALFFEYARDDRSRIGLALGDDVAGPWRIVDDPLTARAEKWDSWHLSPGPIVDYHGRPLMFYNGSTKEIAWRIGWVILNDDFTAEAERCGDPLIVPPAPSGDRTDIAFGASAVTMPNETWLYYSIADQQMKRAVLRAS